jgi:hypothetical protein
VTNIKDSRDKGLFSWLLQRIFLDMHKEKEKAHGVSVSKLNLMPELKILQLRHENESWKRLLNFILDENIHLKHRLAEILKYKSDSHFLEQAEEFQSGFIKKDMLISLLRDDIADMDTCLQRKELAAGEISAEVKNRLKKLRHNIAQTERQFSKMKLDFNSYMSESI